MAINSGLYPYTFSEYIKVTIPSMGFPCLFFMLVFLLSSCATSKNNVGTSSTAHLIENVPFFPQEIYQCGPASLAEVMQYWGIEISPEAIAKDIYSNSAKGTLSLDMVLYAQKNGLNVIQSNGNHNINYLKENIDLGYPVIVMVDYGFWKYQQNHYMVIIGYNNNGIIAHSGKSHHKFIREEDFLEIWKKAIFWALLIAPKQ
ncbi:MAG: C39 family peptidase [Proteobacteria bacterium]|nr:C39 family peptidase [Pseudomonadota bacterium]